MKVKDEFTMPEKAILTRKSVRMLDTALMSNFGYNDRRNIIQHFNNNLLISMLTAESANKIARVKTQRVFESSMRNDYRRVDAIMYYIDVTPKRLHLYQEWQILKARIFDVLDALKESW